ncbi:hypothetical protein ACFQ12_16415 [Methylobacterium trifolii]
MNLADAQLLEAFDLASSRAAMVMVFMSADINADGVVTEEELRTKRRYDHRFGEPVTKTAPSGKSEEQALAEELQRLMAADADKDGRITWIEASNSVPKTLTDRASEGSSKSVREILAFAGREQEGLSPIEFEELFVQAFRSADADHNGTISQEEVITLRRRYEERRLAAFEERRRRQKEEARAGCELPKASERAKVMVLSAYRSDSLSTTTLGSQDVEVGSGFITIEDGSEPLYVVVTSAQPVIWRFSGALDRLERVVLASARNAPNSSDRNAKPLVGATGLPADKVTFLPRPDCLAYFYEEPSVDASETLAIVRRETGKDAISAARYEVSGFTVFSAGIRMSEPADRKTMIVKSAGSLEVVGDALVVVPGSSDGLASMVAHYFPGGVIEIDPASVVASVTPTRYDVLPSEAGLLQLVQSGALAWNRNGEFLIKRKIRFPAELGGAHSARFLLLRGVPEPDGGAWQSCVISEDTGQPLRGSRC